MSLSESHFYDSELKILIKVNPDLNETQQALVLVHEIMHLILIQESRNAGSEDALKENNRDLWNAIEKYSNLSDTSNKTVNQYNSGHHEYMGQHVDEIENILREVYPERDEKFYEYGKWGGGVYNSEAFEELSRRDQRIINRYLRKEHLK